MLSHRDTVPATEVILCYLVPMLKKKDEKMIVSNNFIEVSVLSFQHVISIRN